MNKVLMYPLRKKYFVEFVAGWENLITDQGVAPVIISSIGTVATWYSITGLKGVVLNGGKKYKLIKCIKCNTWTMKTPSKGVTCFLCKWVKNPQNITNNFITSARIKNWKLDEEVHNTVSIGK